MTIEEQTAALLDSVLGDSVSDVVFADLVDDVLDNLASRLASVRRAIASV